VVVCRGEGLGVGQFASELAWLMDQDWQVFGADQEILFLVPKRHQRNLIVIPAAVDAGIVIGHIFSTLMGNYWD
jgi:hypothetical protein